MDYGGRGNHRRYVLGALSAPNIEIYLHRSMAGTTVYRGYVELFCHISKKGADSAPGCT